MPTSRYLRKKTHLKYECGILKDLTEKAKKFLKENEELLVIQSDKGNKTVIIEKSEYDRKVDLLLSDHETYNIISRDPTKKLAAKLKQMVEELYENEYIEKQDYYRLKGEELVAPRMYCVVKIHKENNPLRNIVSTIKAPHSKISKYMVTILNNIVNKDYNVKNSLELKNCIKDMRIAEDYQLVSFDVISLFTNIPIDIVLELIDKKWNEIKKHTDIPLHQFRKLLEVILIEGNYFKCNDKFYSQSFGLAMGVPLAPVLANIVLDDLITTSLRKIPKKVKIVKKYVDDFFIIAHKNIVSNILDVFNSYHPRIKFTVELEADSQINYLDMRIIREDKKLKFDVYRKEISSLRLLNYISYHPELQKLNVVDAFISRTLTISDREFQDKNIVEITEVLKKNNYPIKLIKKHIKKYHYKEQQLREQALTNQSQHTHNLRSRTVTENESSPPETTHYVGVHYIRSLSENVGKVFENNKIGVKIAHSSKNNMNRMYSRHKIKIPKNETNNCVYQIDCGGNGSELCKKSYIGTTKRPLHIRMKEHQRDSQKENLPQNHTALAEHAINNTHQFKTESPKVLTVQNNYIKRMLCESFYIYSSNNTVNYREDTEGVNRIYKNVLRRE